VAISIFARFSHTLLSLHPTDPGSMERKNLFDPATLDAVVARIHRLAPDAAPLWGTMNPAQMLAHCAEVMEVMGAYKHLDHHLQQFGV
jgi:hypothetical protein